jgi:hypothetical protein
MEEKVVVTTSEVQSVEVVPTPAAPIVKNKPPRLIPIWARLVLIPFTLILPLLCLISVILRIALRATAPRTRQAWDSYLNTLLISGGFIFTVIVVLAFSYMPTPPQAISSGMSELDERGSFPFLPSEAKMNGEDLAEALKPLVMVASPAQKRFFGNSELPSGMIGAAFLVEADATGYLFATARHVADGMGWKNAKGSQHVLLTSGMGGWAEADVVGRHKDQDVALLFVPRRSGHTEFYQPVATRAQIKAGEEIYVIGHPEGLNFSISNGIVSRLSDEIVQISAPVSPGNSGGPVYDEHGKLLGVVTSKMDRSLVPNAENLSFAVNADVFTNSQDWELVGNGRDELEKYAGKLKALVNSKPGATPGVNPAATPEKTKNLR